MIIDASGNGSFLFQSLDLSDQGLYTYNANGQFVPVTKIIMGNVMINTTSITIGTTVVINSLGFFLNGSPV